MSSLKNDLYQIMSGLRKAKKYDWKDSNLANFGSDEEKQVKKESAETEPAWEGAGQDVGLKIWRVEQFEVKDWPEADYGKFYNGDTYIILNTYKEDDGDELKYDVHFWIGQESTQDEYGTGAYKTVELDTLLDDKAVQHRQVQDHESALFKSYFPTMTIMKGGCKSGFRHVEPTEYKPRLLKVSGRRKNVTVSETSRARSKVTSGDVFILDLGEELIQWNGCECNKDERFKAAQYCQEIESERGGCSTEVVDEADCPEGHKFYDLLDEELEEDDETDGEPDGVKKLFRLTNESGEMEFESVKEGEDATPEDFNSADTFIYDTAEEVFVWVGADASTGEKANGMNYAHLYTIKNNIPYRSITIMNEGKETGPFKAALCA